MAAWWKSQVCRVHILTRTRECVRVASDSPCPSTLELANTALAWQLSLWITCVLTGAKWQEGTQTVHICAGAFAICATCGHILSTRLLGGGAVCPVSGEINTPTSALTERFCHFRQHIKPCLRDMLRNVPILLLIAWKTSKPNRRIIRTLIWMFKTNLSWQCLPSQ